MARRSAARRRRGSRRGRRPHLPVGADLRLDDVLQENVQLALAARAGRSYDVARPAVVGGVDEAPAPARTGRTARRRASAAAALAYSDLKRLELAIALAGRPRLLLMDEPTAGMAPASAWRLMDLVRELAARASITVLFTEHSMDVVFGFARRILVLSRGQADRRRRARGGAHGSCGAGGVLRGGRRMSRQAARSA